MTEDSLGLHEFRFYKIELSYTKQNRSAGIYVFKTETRIRGEIYLSSRGYPGRLFPEKFELNEGPHMVKIDVEDYTDP